MALIYFAVTLFVSAFLLFLVQPMVGKMILPQLGGTPQVWNTCMMFFQIVLLLGYFYTHAVTTKLKLKGQLLTHCLVLLLPIPVLLMYGRPFFVGDFGAEGGGNPIFQTLGLLTMIVGLPFLVVSTTAPLLQRWFNHSGHPAAKDPYFLYGASNAGSILGLLLYPAGVELFLGLDEQAYFWLFGYILLAALVAGSALFVLKAQSAEPLADAERPDPEPPPGEMPMPPPAPSTAVTAAPPPPIVQRTTAIRRGGKQRGRGGRGPGLPPAGRSPAIDISRGGESPALEQEKPFEMTAMRRFRWVGLAAVPTSMMLGCTTYISTDISPVPLLWIIPLALYLLSFVLVFLRWPVPWVGVGRNPRESTPHKAMVVVQLAAIAVLMVLLMTGAYSPPWRAMAVCWAAFFLTALVCHGELARDRPPPAFLTEFYLWLSVGGMIGGTFNALIAPQVTLFGLFEFPLAIVFACLVRPSGKGEGWTDSVLGAYQSPNGESISVALDLALPVLVLGLSYYLISHTHGSWGWNPAQLIDPSNIRKESLPRVIEENQDNPLFKFSYKSIGLTPVLAYYFTKIGFIFVAFGIGMGCALLAWKRPLRMGLALGAVLLASAISERVLDERVVYRDRSYFGILRVMSDQREFMSSDSKRRTLYKTAFLMHGTTHHGLNYHLPDRKEKVTPLGGKEFNLVDMTRLATTYYHRDGPVGATMEKLNWFPGLKTEKEDFRLTYGADARLPASLIGAGVPGLGINLPIPQIVTAWSEPPYATIGLGTGTMASYARPYQHMAFYEIDEHIRDFSLPPEDRETYFTYLQGAIGRGCKLEVIMGDARLTMKKELKQENSTYYLQDFDVVRGRKSPLKWDTFASMEKRENYYRALEVDAFSSDAIPVHLITKEAIELYMDKLLPNGVLLVHTSNRHVNLVRPVLRICDVAKWKDWTDLQPNGEPKVKEGLAWVVCKDDPGEGTRRFNSEAPSRNGHFGSEYVLVARKQEYLPPYTLTPAAIKEIEETTKTKVSEFNRLMGLTPDQEKSFEEHGVYFPVNNVNYKAFKENNEARLKQGKKELPSVESTITFLTPDNITESQYQGIVNGYGYNVPPGFRVWTDDYSNILSVFRW